MTRKARSLSSKGSKLPRRFSPMERRAYQALAFPGEPGWERSLVRLWRALRHEKSLLTRMPWAAEAVWQECFGDSVSAEAVAMAAPSQAYHDAFNALAQRGEGEGFGPLARRFAAAFEYPSVHDAKLSRLEWTAHGDLLLGWRGWFRNQSPGDEVYFFAPAEGLPKVAWMLCGRSAKLAGPFDAGGRFVLPDGASMELRTGDAMRGEWSFDGRREAFAVAFSNGPRGLEFSASSEKWLMFNGAAELLAFQEEAALEKATASGAASEAPSL